MKTFRWRNYHVHQQSSHQELKKKRLQLSYLMELTNLQAKNLNQQPMPDLLWSRKTLIQQNSLRDPSTLTDHYANKMQLSSRITQALPRIMKYRRQKYRSVLCQHTNQSMSNQRSPSKLNQIHLVKNLITNSQKFWPLNRFSKRLPATNRQVLGKCMWYNPRLISSINSNRRPHCCHRISIRCLQHRQARVWNSIDNASTTHPKRLWGWAVQEPCKLLMLQMLWISNRQKNLNCVG